MQRNVSPIMCFIERSDHNAANLGLFIPEILTQVLLTAASLTGVNNIMLFLRGNLFLFFDAMQFDVYKASTSCMHDDHAFLQERLSACVQFLHFKGQNIPLGHRIVSAFHNSQVPAFSRLQMYAAVLSFQRTFTNHSHFLHDDICQVISSTGSTVVNVPIVNTRD